MVQWLSKFVPNLSKYTEPVTKLKRKNIVFHWNNECKLAFSKIKNAIRLAKPLRYPDFAKTFFVVTDASDHSIGAVLLQKYETYYPIEFISKQLDVHQRNWHCSEKEVFAVVFALEKWKRFLLHKKFILYTDHRNLVELFTKHKHNAKLNRWILRLQPYHFEAKWIAGDENIVADYLSRDVINSKEYINYTIGTHTQLQPYVATETYIMDNTITTTPTTIRRSNKLKKKERVNYTIPNENQIYFTPPQTKQLRGILKNPKSKYKITK